MEEEEEELARHDLPEDVILRILTLLPIRSQVKMRCVCKRWSNLPVSSTPAFCIQVDGRQLWVVEKSTEFYKLPSLPMGHCEYSTIPPPRIRFSGSGICCSWLVKKKDGDRDPFVRGNFGEPADDDLSFFLRNPVANTWRSVRRPPYKIDWFCDFFIYAMGLTHSSSSSSKRSHCTLVFGERLDRYVVGYNRIIIQVYDCESNTWTDPIDVTDDLDDDSIMPVGRGFYSQGKFYWLSLGKCGEVLEFSFASDPYWTKLPVPGPVDEEYIMEVDFLKYDHCVNSVWPWMLTGTDGRILLLNKVSLCMWMLNKEKGEAEHRWVQLHIDLSHPAYSVAVNKNGHILVVGKNISIFDEEGTRLQTIETCEIEFPFDQKSEKLRGVNKIQAFPFECNNSGWPPPD